MSPLHLRASKTTVCYDTAPKNTYLLVYGKNTSLLLSQYCIFPTFRGSVFPAGIGVQCQHFTQLWLSSGRYSCFVGWEQSASLPSSVLTIWYISVYLMNISRWCIWHFAKIDVSQLYSTIVCNSLYDAAFKEGIPTPWGTPCLDARSQPFHTSPHLAILSFRRFFFGLFLFFVFNHQHDQKHLLSIFFMARVRMNQLLTVRCWWISTAETKVLGFSLLQKHASRFTTAGLGCCE